MAALPIILNILKIIGIILLSIIGLVLIILLLILFVPVRYRVNAYRTGEEGDDPVDAKGYVSWLLHIVHISFMYPADEYVTIRIFGIPLRRKDKGETPDSTKGTKTDTDADNDATAAAAPLEGSVPTTEDFADIEDRDDYSSDFFDKPESSDEEQESSEDMFHDGSDDGDASETDDEASFEPEPRKTIFSRISDLINNIKYTIRSACDKIKKIADNIKDKTVSAQEKTEKIRRDIHYYHNILTSELFERTFEKCKKRVIRLLKSILPRKGDIRLEVGFDDPYTTGEVLAIAGMLYPITAKYLRVFGNFEESVIRGGGYLKGRIYGISLVRIVLFYFLDRDLKRLIKLFKKEPVNKKRHGHKGKPEKGRSNNG